MKFNSTTFSASNMANYKLFHHILLIFVVVGVGVLMKCKAALYTVGDTAGWDISSNFDSWLNDKTFHLGDVLLFQYSSYHSVSEVTKESFNGCNITNPISSSRDGNTSIPLTTGGERYFVCGNKLHCLGGMKLQVTTVDDGQNGTAISPASEPNVNSDGEKPGAPSSLPRPSSKKNNLPSGSSTSIGFFHGGRTSVLLILCLSFLIL